MPQSLNFWTGNVCQRIPHGCTSRCCVITRVLLPRTTQASMESKQCIPDSDPGGSNSVFPPELSGISYENNCRKVRSSVGKGCKPRTDTPSSKYKSIYICCMLSAIKANCQHHPEKNYQHQYFNGHNPLSSFSFSIAIIQVM